MFTCDNGSSGLYLCAEVAVDVLCLILCLAVCDSELGGLYIFNGQNIGSAPVADMDSNRVLACCQCVDIGINYLFGLGINVCNGNIGLSEVTVLVALLDKTGLCADHFIDFVGSCIKGSNAQSGKIELGRIAVGSRTCNGKCTEVKSCARELLSLCGSCELGALDVVCNEAVCECAYFYTACYIACLIPCDSVNNVPVAGLCSLIVYVNIVVRVLCTFNKIRDAELRGLAVLTGICFFNIAACERNGVAVLILCLCRRNKRPLGNKVRYPDRYLYLKVGIFLGYKSDLNFVLGGPCSLGLEIKDRELSKVLALEKVKIYLAGVLISCFYVESVAVKEFLVQVSSLCSRLANSLIFESFNIKCRISRIEYRKDLTRLLGGGCPSKSIELVSLDVELQYAAVLVLVLILLGAGLEGYANGGLLSCRCINICYGKVSCSVVDLDNSLLLVAEVYKDRALTVAEHFSVTYSKALCEVILGNCFADIIFGVGLVCGRLCNSINGVIRNIVVGVGDRCAVEYLDAVNEDLLGVDIEGGVDVLLDRLFLELRVLKFEGIGDRAGLGLVGLGRVRELTELCNCRFLCIDSICESYSLCSLLRIECVLAADSLRCSSGRKCYGDRSIFQCVFNSFIKTDVSSCAEIIAEVNLVDLACVDRYGLYIVVYNRKLERIDSAGAACVLYNKRTYDI